MGTWESSGTPENSKLDCRGQNTSPWGFLYTVGKVLKCKCRKWPCMSHSDIRSRSYVQKKGRESNWQFDSRPLKIGNRINLGIDPTSVRAGGVQHTIRKLSRRTRSLLQTSSRLEVWAKSYELPKSRESKPRQFRDNFRTPTWESQDKKPFGCGPRGVTHNILYGGRWWFPQVQAVVSQVSLELPVACLSTKGAPECVKLVGWLLQVRISEQLVPLPSLISELSTRPLNPFQCWKLGAAPNSNYFRSST
jgi:hypothetical protein